MCLLDLLEGHRPHLSLPLRVDVVLWVVYGDELESFDGVVHERGKGGAFYAFVAGVSPAHVQDTIVLCFCVVPCTLRVRPLVKRPGLLERRADVRFALKCQAFIELVKKGELTAAVALAQV